MGLDMWIVSAEKPEEDSIPQMPHKRDLEEAGYTCFVMDPENGEDPKMTDIYEACVYREGFVTCIDWQKVKKEHNIPEDTIVEECIVGKGDIGFSFFDEEGECYSVHFTEDEFPAYTYDDKAKIYITKMEEITYYRGEGQLRALIYEVYAKYSGKCIKNCGYHHLTKEMIRELNEQSEVFREEVFSPEDDSLYYCEWY